METKLLTGAEAARIADLQWPSAIVAELRERGLIAEGPGSAEDSVEDLLATYWVTDWDARDLALAALKRGMEMRAPLTLKMVNQAVRPNVSHNSGGCINFGGILDALNAALTKEQS